MIDGYAGFEKLAASGDIVLAACWAHARRKFYEFHQATGSPIAAEALRRISRCNAARPRNASRTMARTIRTVVHMSETLSGTNRICSDFYHR